MIGLGLLEAIPGERLVALADPNDTDGDGISGRVSWAWSNAYQTLLPGRFGWKAGAATVRDQAAGAFSGDLGLSTNEHPAPYGDCTDTQTLCRAALNGGDPEVTPEMLDWVTFYSANLGVPQRQNPAKFAHGKAAFMDAGCARCHTPKHVTANLTDRDEHALQLIYPYTDLLLHDMGEDLADNRPEGIANGREWRTPPLWGIGLFQQVNGHQQLLHDARARNVEEAILWHGGEGQSARDHYAAMDAATRQHLIDFVNSL